MALALDRPWKPEFGRSKSTPSGSPAERVAGDWQPQEEKHHSRDGQVALQAELTPTGKLPSPGWRWWARAMVAVPLLLLVAVTLAPGPVDPPSRWSVAPSSSTA
jgi:hypothetical protein